MISRFTLDSCQGFHQLFSFSNSPELLFSTSSAGVSSFEANTVVCPLTYLPSLPHDCYVAFVLPVSLAGTNHLSAFSHISALPSHPPFLTWDFLQLSRNEIGRVCKALHLQYTKSFLHTDLFHDA